MMETIHLWIFGKQRHSRNTHIFMHISVKDQRIQIITPIPAAIPIVVVILILKFVSSITGIGVVETKLRISGRGQTSQQISRIAVISRKIVVIFRTLWMTEVAITVITASGPVTPGM